MSACGSIYTPALLLSSGFKHPKIGKYLTFHPVVGAAGLFEKNERTELYSGVGMAVVIKPPKNLSRTLHEVSLKFINEKDIANHQTHAVAIETPPVHLGIFGFLIPWNSGIEFKVMGMSHQNTSAVIGISRDHCYEKNEIIIDNEGNPIIHYSLSKEDEKMLLIGLERQIRILYARGAKFIILGHSRFPMFYCEQENSAEKLNEYITAIWKEGVVYNRMNVFSAHQMSSCRIASSSENGPTSPTGELYECENLFIADGSVLPTSLGINPMITIEAMSHMISKNVLQKLQTMK